MLRYVHEQNRGPSPQAGHSGKPNRAAVAANAKVPMAKTILRHDDQSSNQARGQGRMAYPHSPPASQLQQSQLSRQDHDHQAPQQDAYDTDAASIDTTQPRGSYVQAGPGQNEAYHEQDGDSDDVDDNQSEQGESEDGEYEDHELNEYDEVEQYLGDSGRLVKDSYTPLIAKEALARIQPVGLFDDNHSYPTTTSGNLDEASSDDFENHSVRSPSPARPPGKIKPQQLQQQSEPQQSRTYAAPNATPAATQKGTIHQRGATNRSTTVFPSTAPVPQRGVPYQSGLSRPHEAQPHGKRSRNENEAALRIQPVPPPAIRISEEKIDHALANASPIEDYEAKDLFAMEYTDLKQEDFDTVPRGKPSVLSSDMQKKPLAERLQHVHGSLNDDDKATFLGSLPTTEWENAGDWFIEQFSSILKRTKEARQTKRKLAIEFEEEVETRHQHVAKKQSTVNSALQKMQSQGQGLIRSPRRG